MYVSQLSNILLGNKTRNKPLSTQDCHIPLTATWSRTGIVLIGHNSSCGSKENTLCNPSDLFLDNENNIYIADTKNNRIQKLDPFKKSVSTVAEVGLHRPSNLFVDIDTNDLYILDYSVDDTMTYRVQYWKQNATNGIIIMNGTTRSKYGSVYMTLDNDRNIYISEFDNHRVKKCFVPDYIHQITVAKSIQKKNDEQDMGPRGLFVDENDTLYFLDDSNFQLRKWLKGATYGLTIASNLPPATRFTFDCHGNVYFGSTDGKRRIYQYDILYNTLKVIAEGTTTSYINAVKLDAFGNLYAIDRANNQLIKYSILK